MTQLARLLHRVRAALERGDFVEAESLCRAVLELAPHHEEALSFLALRMLSRGEPGKARDLLEATARESDASGLVLYHYGRALADLGDHRAARATFDRAHRAEPSMVMSLFLRGEQEQALGDEASALRSQSLALDQARVSGLLTDVAQLPPDMGRSIRDAHAHVTRARADAFGLALAPLIERHGEAKLRRVLDALEIQSGQRPAPKAKPHQHPCFLLIPDLDASPWHARERFPELAAIEARTDEIRAEVVELLRDEGALTPYVDMPEDAQAAPIWRTLNRSPRWSGFHFYRDGEVVSDHATRCPRTFAALEALPLMRVPGHAPEALFSVLAPRTRIPSHTGVMNGRLTVHLPLIVPPNCGGLRCGEIEHEWVEGRSMVFDDSLRHSARNDSDHTRVVLIFDLWHPDLDPIERDGVTTLIAAIAAFNQRYGRDIAG